MLVHMNLKLHKAYCIIIITIFQQFIVDNTQTCLQYIAIQLPTNIYNFKL
jgi:hypothetical protein